MKTTRKIKTYVTDRGNLNTCVRVNGKSVRVRFVSKDNVNGHFFTSDTDLQRAMEEDCNYGVKFDIHLSEQELPEETTPFECTPVLNIATWQQAKEYMHAPPYNVPLKSLTSPEKVKYAAQSKGVIFPNIDK